MCLQTDCVQFSFQLVLAEEMTKMCIPNQFRPLNTELFSLETSFTLCMPLMHRISVSVQALTPKLSLSPLSALASRLVTLTTPTH